MNIKQRSISILKESLLKNYVLIKRNYLYTLYYLYLYQTVTLYEKFENLI